MNVPGIFKPATIIQDKRLTPIEADYLCLVAYLEKRGACTESNQFFADYFKVSRCRAVEVLTKLKAKGFIMSSDKKQGGKTIQREIFIMDQCSKEALLPQSREQSTPGAVKPDRRRAPGAGGLGRIKYE